MELHIQLGKTYLNGYNKEVTITSTDWINDATIPIYISKDKDNSLKKYTRDGTVLWGSDVNWDSKYNLHKEK